jgi:hypothetical protein
MQMEAIKAALQDLLSAMDGEDKRVLSEKLSAPKVEVEVESEPMEGEKCADCGSESCTCEE